jgi:hypothetical protein
MKKTLLFGSIIISIIVCLCLVNKKHFSLVNSSINSLFEPNVEAMADLDSLLNCAEWDVYYRENGDFNCSHTGTQICKGKDE